MCTRYELFTNITRSKQIKTKITLTQKDKNTLAINKK